MQDTPQDSAPESRPDADERPETGVVQTASADHSDDAGFLAAAERLGQRAEMLGTSGTAARKPAPAVKPIARPAAKPVAFAAASTPVAETEPAPAPPPVAIGDAQPSEPRQRGLPPSTLNAQAWALTGRSQPPPAQPQYEQRQVTRVSAAAGAYEVQIGAYGSIAEAQRALNSVQDRAKKLLAGVPSVTHPATANGRQIFRARFAGFDAGRAASTCTELRRKGVDCFVMAGQ
jgi:D-alanyl-D-alanine carboxypeptidase